MTFEKVWLMFKETDKKLAETGRQINKTDRTLSERFKETDKKIKDLSDLFSSQWGQAGGISQLTVQVTSQ